MVHLADEHRLAWVAADIVTPEDLAGEFLSELVRFMGATRSVVYYFSSRGRLEPLGGNTAGAVPEYGQRFAPEDPMLQASMARGKLPFVTTQQSDRPEILDEAVFRGSSVYREHYRAIDMEHFAFVFPSNLALGESGMVGFMLGRHRSAEPFEAGRLAQLAAVEGALRAAVRRMLRARGMQQQRDVLATMMSRAEAYPIAMLDERQKLLWASDDGLSRFGRHAGVLAAIQQQAAQLHAALNQRADVEAPWTFRVPLGAEHVLRGEFEIVRDSWLRPLTACLFEVESATRTLSPNLTAAETRVLDGLVEGLSNKELGEKLGVSTDTVRTHVQRVLSKLGVDSRVKAALWAVEHRKAP